MKGNHNFSILQGKGKRCYLSDQEGVPLEKHHIYYGSALRKISDRCGFWVWLTPELHRGTYGVHGREGHNLDLLLKRDCQRAYEEENTRESFMKLIGRNYLDDE